MLVLLVGENGMPVPVIKSNETGYYLGIKRKQDFCALNIARSTAQLINQSGRLEWLEQGALAEETKQRVFQIPCDMQHGLSYNYTLRFIGYDSIQTR